MTHKMRAHPQIANFKIEIRLLLLDDSGMDNTIYPRSPREIMDGWYFLPRYIDKIRLHLAGKLHADYRDNLGRGFDGLWLKAAGVSHHEFVEVVKNSITDGEIYDWVRKNVKRTHEQKAAHWTEVLSRPPAGDETAQARLKMRLAESNLAHRTDIKTFVDYIDADEKRI